MRFADLRNLNIKLPPVSLSTVPSRYKVFLAPALAVSVSVILLLLVLRPRLDLILQSRQDVKDKEVQLENIKAKVDELSRLNRTKLTADVKLVNRALPFEKDVPGAVLGIERLAADSGLIIDSLALSPGEVSTQSATTEAANELEIKTSLRGPFLAIKEFTAKIRKSLRVFTIKDATISVSGGDTSNLSANFSLITHFSPLAKAGTKIDVPLPKLTDQEKQILARITNYQFVSSIPTSTSSSRVDPFANF